MTLGHLDTMLSYLHDRGILNVPAFEGVCAELVAGYPITLEHLSRIFGTAPIGQCCTRPDETARLVVMEALDLLTNPESVVNLKDWTRAAEQVIGSDARRC
jgi:hypothetical protein